MDINEEKLVEFDKYCQTCRFKDLKEEDEPCAECLDNPVNLFSHKPLKWKEAKGMKHGRTNETSESGDSKRKRV